MVKYPTGSKQSFTNEQKPTAKTESLAFSRRGMTLEEEINESNEYYLAKEIAVIHKKPTPIQIVNVDYPKRSRAIIKEAYFRQASTTDYNGVYQGRYLDFEAKETKNKLSFPLKNFHQHQITHFKHCLLQDGICFVIIRFSELQRYFVTPASLIIQNFEDPDVKSIPLPEIMAVSVEITAGFRPVLPYLTAIDQLIKNESDRKND